MTSRKGRIARRIFRWACRLLALVVLAILACAIYLERAGLPEFLKRRLVASVRAKGWEFDYSRLRFHWQRGIIGENIQLRPAEKKPGPFLFVEEAACQLNRRALRNFEIEVDSVLLRGGRLVWQFAATNEPTATFQLDRIGGELIFAANDLWRLQSLSAEMLGTELQISGTLTNASRIRDWKLPKGSRSAEATQALWRRIVSTAGKVKFTGQPQLITRLNGSGSPSVRRWRSSAIGKSVITRRIGPIANEHCKSTDFG